MTDKIFRLLGMGRAAGSAACGSSAVITAIKRRRCQLVLIAGDCGEATFGKFKNMCISHNIPYLIIPSKTALGKAVGYDEKAVVGITDANLAKGITDNI